MNNDILEALQQITKDKNIEMDYLIETLESSLLTAAKKKFGNAENLEVKVDYKTGEIIVTMTKKIVETVGDPNTEISLEMAKSIEKKSIIIQKV